MRGFEPPTLGTTIRCSNQLSYIHRFHTSQWLAFCESTIVFNRLQTVNLLQNTILQFRNACASANLHVVFVSAGGELLSALADCGSYTEEDAQSCFIQLLQTLSYLHANGIIHRDLKLENLIMTKPGERVNFIKLIDFGMAKFVWEPETDETVIGTPLYVSPEILSSASKQSEKVNPYTRAVSELAAFPVVRRHLQSWPSHAFFVHVSCFA